ncbi:hypothetical protein BJ546DRAFT_948785 [Cryomyces antarcticus]
MPQYLHKSNRQVIQHPSAERSSSASDFEVRIHGSNSNGRSQTDGVNTHPVDEKGLLAVPSPSAASIPHTIAGHFAPEQRRSQASSIAPKPQPIDPASIVEWRIAVRCITKIVAQNESLGDVIRRMMLDQRKHEMQWYELPAFNNLCEGLVFCTHTTSICRVSIN